MVYVLSRQNYYYNSQLSVMQSCIVVPMGPPVRLWRKRGSCIFLISHNSCCISSGSVDCEGHNSVTTLFHPSGGYDLCLSWSGTRRSRCYPNQPILHHITFTFHAHVLPLSVRWLRIQAVKLLIVGSRFYGVCANVQSVVITWFSSIYKDVVVTEQGACILLVYCTGWCLLWMPCIHTCGCLSGLVEVF